MIATLARGTIVLSQAAISKSRKAPAGLINPLRSTSVSRSAVDPHDPQQHRDLALDGCDLGSYSRKPLVIDITILLFVDDSYLNIKIIIK
jgi:hypothetical protein